MGVDMVYCEFCQECVHTDDILRCRCCGISIEYDDDKICDRCINDVEHTIIKDQNNNYFCGKECQEDYEEEEKERREQHKKLFYCEICNVDIKVVHEKTKKHKTNLKKIEGN